MTIWGTRPFGFETLTVAASSIGFTAATIAPANASPATRAVVGPLETAQVRYRTDGTDPTAAVGHLLEIGDVLVIEGVEAVAKARFIRTGSTSAALPVTFER